MGELGSALGGGGEGGWGAVGFVCILKSKYKYLKYYYITLDKANG